jgi:hypothetical protein
MGMQQTQQMGVQQNVLNTQTGMMEPRMIQGPQGMQQRIPGQPGMPDQKPMEQQPRPMTQQGQIIGQPGMITAQRIMPGQPPGMAPNQRPGMIMTGQRPGMMPTGQQSMMQGQQPSMSGGMPAQRPSLPDPRTSSSPDDQPPGMPTSQQPGMMQQPPQNMGPGQQPRPQQAQQTAGNANQNPQASTQQSVHFQKWEADEPLGDQATIAMILYANVNNPNLKTEYPNWSDRMKQIAKIWKNLPNEKRAPYVQKARENRTANRMNRGPVSIFHTSFVFW